MPTATLENLFELSAVVAPLAAAGGRFATILFFFGKAQDLEIVYTLSFLVRGYCNVSSRCEFM